jgi:hypothetical protein
VDLYGCAAIRTPVSFLDPPQIGVQPTIVLRFRRITIGKQEDRIDLGIEWP